MYLLLLWFSFFSFIVAISMGSLIGSHGVFYIAISCLFFCFLFFIYFCYKVSMNSSNAGLNLLYICFSFMLTLFIYLLSAYGTYVPLVGSVVWMLKI